MFLFYFLHSEKLDDFIIMKWKLSFIVKYINRNIQFCKLNQKNKLGQVEGSPNHNAILGQEGQVYLCK